MPTRSAGVFVRSANGLDGSAALLRRHAAGCDGLGRAALGQVLGVRGDDAARAARRHPAGRQRRDDRGPGPRRPAAASTRPPRSSCAGGSPGTRSSCRRRCCSGGSATRPRARSASGSPARSTTGSPRTSPRSATWWTTSPPAPPTRPSRQQIGQLRQEVTRVVTELRHSIFDLRHELAAGAGLGESLSAYANQVSATSPMTVHVTLDEKGPRLPGRRRVRAAPDRPGGDGQRPQALRRGEPVAALHRPVAVRRDRGARRRHQPHTRPAATPRG